MAAAYKAKRQSDLIANLETDAKDAFLNLRTVAVALGVHPSTVRGWVSTGAIRATRFPNGLYRIRKSDLERLLEASPMGDDELIVEKIDALKDESE